MKYNFEELLDNIKKSSKFGAEAKSNLQGGTMQLWAIFDKINGGSGIVEHNGEIVDFSKLQEEKEEIPLQIEPPIPTPPPLPQPTQTEKPKQPKETKVKKPKLTLKELNIDIKSINLDDL